jgi:hypothetical protein
MQRDPIIEEIHAIREAFAKDHNDDLVAMFTTLRRHQRESGREVVSFAPRPCSTDALPQAHDTMAAQQSDRADHGPRKASG